MARKPVFETCMFCTPGESCPIHAAKAQPKPRKKAPKPQPTPVAAEHDCAWCTPEERAAGMPCACNNEESVTALPAAPVVPSAPVKDMRAAMRRHARPEAKAPAAPLAQADSIMDDALRALAPILHPDEIKKYRHVIAQPTSIQQRASAWKQRVRGQNG